MGSVSSLRLPTSSITIIRLVSYTISSDAILIVSESNLVVERISIATDHKYDFCRLGFFQLGLMSSIDHPESQV